MLIDTHCHLYTDAFDIDRKEAVERAIQAGVRYAILPGIDKENHTALMRTVQEFPHFCLPAVGLHPTSVSLNYREELEFIEQMVMHLAGAGGHTGPPLRTPFVAVGEIGIDGYWSKEFMAQQRDAFERQLEWAAACQLPVIIHNRNGFDELFEILYRRRDLNLSGVFHAFSGSYEQFKQIQKCGAYKIGIGGVITYKNSGLAQTLPKIDLSYVVLETDAPWLTPVPHRGKRNESSYLPWIAQKVSEVLGISIEKVAETTTQNACDLFNLSYLCRL